MLGQIVLLAFVLFIPPIAVYFIIGSINGRRFAWLLFGAGIFYLGLLWYIDGTLPYSGGGDDSGYDLRTRIKFSSIEDWFDIKRFSGGYEQPGYPLVLAWTNQFSEDNLFVKKTINLFFFLCLAIVWFFIGKNAGGENVGRIIAFSMLVATPLWYYWMFLFKDILITLIQSIFLLGAVGIVSRRKIFANYLTVVISTIVLIPLRAPLIVINLFFLVLVLLQSVGGVQVSRRKRLTYIFIGMASIIGLINFGQNIEYLEALGVEEETRALSVESYSARIEEYQESSKPNAFIFPALFVLGETTALNPESWTEFDATLLRGITMIPWIAIGVPFFFYGLYFLLFRGSKLTHPVNCPALDENVAPIGNNNRKAWFLIMIFAMSYMAIAWVVGDTTRWRIPGFPAMVALASLGWINLKPDERYRVVIMWTVPFGVAIASYYLFYK